MSRMISKMLRRMEYSLSAGRDPDSESPHSDCRTDVVSSIFPERIVAGRTWRSMLRLGGRRSKHFVSAGPGPASRTRNSSLAHAKPGADSFLRRSFPGHRSMLSCSFCASVATLSRKGNLPSGQQTHQCTAVNNFASRGIFADARLEVDLLQILHIDRLHGKAVRPVERQARRVDDPYGRLP